jgi:nitroimidazol reductase NimA-like FMN-containing flavoprotein (pyridoxamine 5'-phosphate oxidase superfamily)
MPKAKVRTPTATRPYMPGYLDSATGQHELPKTKKGLLPWKWAEERLKKSRQYWIATVRPDARPHVMVVWALWLDGVLYFSTGRYSRKAKNLAANPQCTMGTEDASEAVFLEGMVDQEKNARQIRRFIRLYEKKYNWPLGGMADDLIALRDPVFYLRPNVAFGLWEKKFATTATRRLFS